MEKGRVWAVHHALRRWFKIFWEEGRPFLTDKGAQLRRQDVARLRIEVGAPLLRGENARLSGWVYAKVRGRGRQVRGDVRRLCRAWSAQFECLERATERQQRVVP